MSLLMLIVACGWATTMGATILPVRTGHLDEALDEAVQFQQAIERREVSFVSHFRTWIESPDRR